MTAVPDPWQVLARTDLVLERLPIRELGRYYHRLRVIVIRRGLLVVEERAVLWHELVHARRGDLSCWAKTEHGVDREAARWALPLPAMLETYRWARSDVEAADELKTTPQLLQVRLAAMHPSEKAALARVRQSLEGAA